MEAVGWEGEVCEASGLALMTKHSPFSPSSWKLTFWWFDVFEFFLFFSITSLQLCT